MDVEVGRIVGVSAGSTVEVGVSDACAVWVKATERRVDSMAALAISCSSCNWSESLLEPGTSHINAETNKLTKKLEIARDRRLKI